MRLVGLLLLATVTLGEDPECPHCDPCVPRRWAAKEGILGGYNAKSGPGSFAGVIKFAYDEFVQKIVAFSEMYVGGKKYDAYTLFDYKRGLRYLITLHGGEKVCNVTRIPDKFPPRCLPGAKFLGHSYLGEKPMNDLETSAYQMFIKAPNAKGVATITYTKEGSIPIGEIIQGDFNGVGVMEVVGFSEVTREVNKKDFIVPKICRRQEDKAREEADPIKENPTLWDIMEMRVKKRFSNVGF